MTTLLVDFSSVFHIRWHADPTHPVDGAIASVRRCAESYDRVVVCLDSYPTWRHELYPPYKANRGEKDPALYASLDRAAAALRAEYHVVAVAGFEADDVIASLAMRFREEGESVVVYTSDKDLMQLVCPGCQMLSTKNDLLFDAAACKLKFGVPPELVGDFLALVGDASDNVPGVRGVGPKRAAELLTAHGSIAGVIAAAKDPKSTLTPKLREALTMADEDGSLAMSRKLVSLDDTCPVNLDAFAPRADVLGAIDKAMGTTLEDRIERAVFGTSHSDRERIIDAVDKMIPGFGPRVHFDEDGAGGVWSRELEDQGIEDAIDEFNEQQDRQRRAAQARPEANPPPKTQERKAMSQFKFKKATREKAKLRLALMGPSGSGKTLSALAVARGLGDRVAVIDTERGSASKYAGRNHEGAPLEFDVLELETFAPTTYVEAIHAAEAAGYDVIVVDSLSHAWMGRDGALEQVDNAARKQHGNSFGAWRNVTPQHNALVDAMVGCKAHLIVTMRTKTEYVQEKDERTGKTVVRKIGLAPVQRDGLEYEFDVVGDVDLEHVVTISKTRCDDIADQSFRKPGLAFAEKLAAWLSEGSSPAPRRNFVLELETAESAEALAAIAADVKAAGEAGRLGEQDKIELKQVYARRHRALTQQTKEVA